MARGGDVRQLRRGFEGFTRQAPYATGDVVLFSAVTSALSCRTRTSRCTRRNNYDGQLTGQQRGPLAVRARPHREIPESRLTLSPGAGSKPITQSPRSAFDVLLDSIPTSSAIMQSRHRGRRPARSIYDDDYFEKFFASMKPILEKRLAHSITATAAASSSAPWEAGRTAGAEERRRAGAAESAEVNAAHALRSTELWTFVEPLRSGERDDAISVTTAVTMASPAVCCRRRAMPIAALTQIVAAVVMPCIPSRVRMDGAGAEEADAGDDLPRPGRRFRHRPSTGSK